MTRNSKLFLFVLLMVCFTVNACKKDEVKTSLTGFLTRKPWKLALLQRFAYVNSSLVKTDTLQSNCALTQTLTFDPANTYIFENYVCQRNSNVNASWSFTNDNQYLNLNSAISLNSARTQNVSRIINLGEYSLIFDSGDVNILPASTTDSTIIFRYGFIH